MFISSTYDRFKFVDLVHAITGWDTSLLELEKVGERVYSMARAFNAREGFNRKDDYLPKKIYKQLLGKGPTAGTSWKEEDLERAKDTYYALAGWDVKTGNPTQAKLKELGLDWIAL